MSTTVIASRIGRRLAVASWTTPAAIDADALRRVLERHGLDLLPGALDVNEVIVAEGLPAARAADLAQDLRAIGLTARVVNQPSLTQSRRVATALEIAVMAIIFTLPLVPFAVLSDLLLLATLLALPGLFFVLNAATLVWRGGANLSTVGAPRSVEADVDRWAEALRGELPEPLLASLLERVRELELEARCDPDGPAAAELAELRADDAQRRRAEAADKARALREELHRARQAAAEVRKLQ